MTSQTQDPVVSHQPTICSVCAWRENCQKKYSYDASGPIKCADFTRDARLDSRPKEGDK